MKDTQMAREEVQDFVASLFAEGKTPSDRFGMTCASLSELERDVIDFNLIGDVIEMKDKFIVVDCMGIKQVGINGDKCVSILDTEHIVNMMNGFNRTCEKLEKDLSIANEGNDYLLGKVTEDIIKRWGL